jgi:hypothetical protein
MLESLEPRQLLSAAFAAHVDYTTGYQPQVVVTGDFNHDGKADLATINNSSSLDPGTISILLGNGDGTFGPNTDLGTDIGPTDLVVGDFNGDSKDDLAVASYDSNTVDIFLQGSGGSFTESSFTTGDGPAAVAVGYFNGDNITDLAVGCNGTGNLELYTGDGSGGYGVHSRILSFYLNSLGIDEPISFEAG